MSATFKSKHDNFPSLMQQSQPQQSQPQQSQPQQSQPQQSQEPVHVYNPKSNAFGALAQKQPKKPKQPNQKSFQPTQHPEQSQQPEARPMTMAERLKNPPAKVAAPVAPVAAKPMQVKFDMPMPAKSQFWWQDED